MTEAFNAAYRDAMDDVATELRRLKVFIFIVIAASAAMHDLHSSVKCIFRIFSW